MISTTSRAGSFIFEKILLILKTTEFKVILYDVRDCPVQKLKQLEMGSEGSGMKREK